MIRAIFMLLFVATFGTHAAYLRGKAVGQAGALILRVVRPPISLWTALLLVPAAFFAVLIVIFLQRALEGSLEKSTVVHGLLSILGMLAVTIAAAIMSRGVHLELRENGILVRASFWPWAKINGFSWNDRGSTVRLQIAGFGPVEYRIAAKQNDGLNQLLAHHC